MTSLKVGHNGTATTTRVRCASCGGEAYRNGKGQLLAHTTPRGDEVCATFVRGARP